MYFPEMSAACEDHIEIGDVLYNFTFTLTDLDTAARAVTDYVTLRLETIAESQPQPLALMVSGGVDSLHMAACAAKAGIEVVAYTVAWPGSQQAMDELAVAKAACDKLGIVHVAVRPTDSELSQLLADMALKLQTSEPWEVLAGACLYAVAQKVPADVAIVSAAGADTLMRGGKAFAPSHSVEDTLGRWEAQVKGDIRRGFTRQHFIPDFHERILGPRAGRYFKVWQTCQAIDLASRLHPKVVRGGDWKDDKLVLRRAAALLGVAESDTSKSPMQVSSGLVEAIEKLVREELAHQFKGRTYSDPNTEDVGILIARLYLDKAWARAAAWPARHEL